MGSAALQLAIDLPPGAGYDSGGGYRRHPRPAGRGVRGFLRARRNPGAAAGGPEFFTLYETQDGDVLSSPAYVERLNNPTEWTRRALPRMARMVRHGYRLLGSRAHEIGPRLLTVRILPHSGREPIVREALMGEAVGALAEVVDVTACAVYETLPAAGSVLTEERRIVGGAVTAAPPFLALCEHRDAASALRDLWAAWGRRVAADVTLDDYRLLYGLAWLAPRAAGGITG